MKRRLLTLLKIAPLVFLLDQLTKHWVVRFIPLHEKIPVLPGCFDLVSIRNRGAAFGSFASLPDGIRLPFFYLTSGVALAFLLFYYFRKNEEGVGVYRSLSLILGGAMGNISDRLFRGEVVDFLSFHWREKWVTWVLGDWRGRFKLEWPAFNLADSAITIAVVCLLIFMLKEKKKD